MSVPTDLAAWTGVPVWDAKQAVGGFWLPGLPASVPVARHCARVVLRVPVGDEIDDVLLVLTELTANAITHTRSGLPGGRVRVEFELDGPTRLLVKVIDQGSAKVPHPRTPTAAIQNDGRGLHLVGSLAKEWGVRWPGRGCVVWALIELPASEKADTGGLRYRTTKDRPGRERRSAGSGGHMADAVAGTNGRAPAVSLYEVLCAAARRRQSDDGTS
ncbi:ATP-binding protein [Nonomuraea sp. NPDC050404]|uniref:ATP-binding protein n=1 Tax=Nonomuraea sp. NPDC050404 TaxID=3155783 RepID=UPI0033F46D2E